MQPVGGPVKQDESRSRDLTPNGCTTQRYPDVIEPWQSGLRIAQSHFRSLRVNAGTLDATLAPAYRTEPGVEARLRAPAAEVATVNGGRWWSVRQTIEALFCRAAPSLSSYFHDILGEDGANELDE